MKRRLLVACAFLSAVSCSIAWGQKATTVQLPTFGVAIDAAGLLKIRAVPDPRGQQHLKRIRAAKAALPQDLQRQAKLRSVSLRRLEAALQRRLDQRLPPDHIMQNLAGLQRVEYVFVLPDQKDIIIAGPAEGFCLDGSGRSVGITTGLPTLQLDDLIVALRAFVPGAPLEKFIGCTIDPTQEGLQRLRTFQRTIPRVISNRDQQRVGNYVATGMRNSLGVSPIRVFGISPKTRFAQVLVECDYRMKLIGIGLEPTPVKMVTFISALRRPNSRTLQRWWFTPFYDTVTISDDRLAIEFRGQGVQLKSEDKIIDDQGRLRDSGQPVSKPNRLFASSFTSKYESIGRKAAVFAHMRNLIDLSVAAAFLRKFDGYRRANWQPGAFFQEQTFSVENLPEPQRVAAAVNAVWKGNRLVSPAGGVSIQPHRAFDKEHLKTDPDGALHKARQAQQPPAKAWWWDSAK